MKAWWKGQKEKFQIFFREYGKVTLVVFLLPVCLISGVCIVLLSQPAKLKVSFLDIGQGDAILIQTPSKKKMLIDGGPSNVVLSRIADEVSYFTRDIDVMLETHPDADHVTGLIPVLEKYNVHTVVTSPGVGSTGVFEDLEKHIIDEQADVYLAHTGDLIDFHDGVLVKVLYPPQKYVAKKNDTNDASVSVVVVYGDHTFLLTGDLASNQEGKLLEAELQKNITVYKAGHHGSKYSSGEQLLSYIRPEYSVISAGKDNKYGHPNPEALARLQTYSKEILSTIERGTISFETDGRTLEVETSR